MLLAVLAAACTQPASDPPAPTPSTPAAEPTPSATTRPGTYTNPVFDHDAPDPGVLRAPDGTYYAYTTQSIYLDIVEIPILASRDLVHWRQVGDAFPHAPDWVVGGSAGDMWAPHPLYWKGKYLLFYSGRRVSDGAMAIGVASSASPSGPFRDLGHPLLTRSKGQPTYTVIDPFVLADNGTLWLYWGSNDQPIRVARLNDTATRVVGTPNDAGAARAGSWARTAVWSRGHGSSRSRLVLPLLLGRGLLLGERELLGLRCALPSPGRTVSSRARTTPSCTRTATSGRSGTTPRHATTPGNDWLVYHARSRESVSDDRVLMLDRIVWRAGWPTVAADTGASWTAQPVPEVTSR